MNRRKFLASLGIGTAAAITGTKLLEILAKPEKLRLPSNLIAVQRATTITGGPMEDVIWYATPKGAKSWIRKSEIEAKKEYELEILKERNKLWWPSEG